MLPAPVTRRRTAAWFDLARLGPLSGALELCIVPGQFGRITKSIELVADLPEFAAEQKRVDPVLVGGAVWLAMVLWPDVHVAVRHPLAMVWFGLMGALMLSFLGLLTSIWAEKFDHAAAVTNFVVAPLSLLSGTFYAVDALAPLWRGISHANPFFYVISGFRYGFLERADSPVLLGAALLAAINLALLAACFLLLRSGWKIKN